jgi:hypothetical protein
MSDTLNGLFKPNAFIFTSADYKAHVEQMKHISELLDLQDPTEDDEEAISNFTLSNVRRVKSLIAKGQPADMTVLTSDLLDALDSCFEEAYSLTTDQGRRARKTLGMAESWSLKCLADYRKAVMKVWQTHVLLEPREGNGKLVIQNLQAKTRWALNQTDIGRVPLPLMTKTVIATLAESFEDIKEGVKEVRSCAI